MPVATAQPEISVGSRAEIESRPDWIAAFAISLAISIVLHAAVIGADLVRLPSPSHPDETPVPVTVVEDPQPEKAAEPQTQAVAPKEEAKPPAPETPAPKPETAVQKEEPKQPPSPSAAEPAPPKEAPSTASSDPQTETAKPEPANPAAAVLDDKSAHSAVAALRAQIERCWTIPTGWTNPHQVTVVIDLRLERSGALSGRPVPVEFSASQLGMQAAKSAIEAVTKCAPYRLPPDQYDKWHEAQVRLAPP
jgi:outer membrane biosynthesis protein TonB